MIPAITDSAANMGLGVVDLGPIKRGLFPATSRLMGLSGLRIRTLSHTPSGKAADTWTALEHLGSGAVLGIELSLLFREVQRDDRDEEEGARTPRADPAAQEGWG